MKLSLKICTLSILISFFSSIYADVIRLNGGQIIEGAVVAESDKILVIDTATGQFRIRKEDILERQRPGGNPLARPEQPQLNATTVALRSFVPFYSGFYETDDEEFGVLFATLQGGYALAALDNMPGLRFDKGWSNSQFLNSPLSKGQAASEFVFWTQKPFFLTDLDSILTGYVSMQYLTQNSDSYFPVKTVLTGSYRTKKDSDNNFRNAVRGYLITSTIHAALTWWHVSSYGGRSLFAEAIGAPADSNIQAYIVPTGGRDFQFGMIMNY